MLGAQGFRQRPKDVLTRLLRFVGNQRPVVRPEADAHRERPLSPVDALSAVFGDIVHSLHKGLHALYELRDRIPRHRIFKGNADIVGNAREFWQRMHRIFARRMGLQRTEVEFHEGHVPTFDAAKPFAATAGQTEVTRRCAITTNPEPGARSAANSAPARRSPQTSPNGDGNGAPPIQPHL